MIRPTALLQAAASDVRTESAPSDSSNAADDPDSAEDCVGFVLDAIELVFPSLSKSTPGQD